ncbi:MAG: hypothetical protein U9Q15_00895 [Patescibacteria group bacterium]|nr:hypothetical protein [Patescibacteria group bacterium]
MKLNQYKFPKKQWIEALPENWKYFYDDWIDETRGWSEVDKDLEMGFLNLYGTATFEDDYNTLV